MALIVVTGGARSGKSAAAQRLVERRAAETGAPVVVAVFGSADGDPEMEARIERHRADRPGSFAVIEATGPFAWTAEVSPDALLLVDCLGTLTGLAMARNGSESALDPLLAALTDMLRARTGDTVVVTNEVGSGVVPAYESGRVFRDVLGRANAALAASADAAYLAVSGRLLDLHALPSEMAWPSRKDTGL